MTLYEMKLAVVGLAKSVIKSIKNIISVQPSKEPSIHDIAKALYKTLSGYESNSSDDYRKNMWANFKEEIDSDEDILTTKTKALAYLMTKFAYEFAKTFHVKLTKEKIMHQGDSDKEFQICLETICLYFNAVDREACKDLDANKRKSFINKLMMEVCLIVSQMPNDKILKENIMTIFIDMCNARQMEYGTYKIMPSSDGTFGGTLFWEYGKKVSKISLGTEFSVLIILEAIANAVASIKAMQLRELFSSI